MYASASEVVGLIRVALREGLGQPIETVRTLESGVVEEFAIVRVTQASKTLLLRVWPIFYAPEKRVEFKLYHPGEHLRHISLAYLKIFSTVNAAELTEKT